MEMAKQEVDTLETDLEKMARKPVGYNEPSRKWGSASYGERRVESSPHYTAPTGSGKTTVRKPVTRRSGQSGDAYAPVYTPPQNQAEPY